MPFIDQVGNLATAVDDTDGYFSGGRFIIPGGVVDDDVIVDDVQAFDPDSGDTTIVATLPQPVGYTAAAPYPPDGTIYTLGGIVGDTNDATPIYEFDVANESVGKVADLNTGRDNHTAVYNPGTETIFCWGANPVGQDGPNFSSPIEEFDPGDYSVTDVGSTNPTYKDIASVYLNGSMYQMFGDQGAEYVTADVYEITENGGYSEVGTLTLDGDPYPMSTTRATQVGGNIYTFAGSVADGSGGFDDIDTVFRFDTSWALEEIGTTARVFSDAIPAVDPSTDRVYNAGGSNRSTQTSYSDVYVVGAGSAGSTEFAAPGNRIVLLREDLGHL